ncbi:hypothetical protein F0L74_21380 [Chitinophaga agrisoli]|uniref:SEFIR domain-containing protein n=1 Tax=Chitinophaga agrisoli TaxID=2607653 RepID=A0A5B2VJM0_9BACT|nr:hypothetical protein [Chitinophaga agrisoli]KAA2238770.1 hypothetical protein F0L74_21380 [Chitinophaga agrisoli]
MAVAFLFPVGSYNKTTERSSIDFSTMMNYAIQDSDKVVVVLSRAYKRKAEENKGGVGVEYNLILGDIDKHTNKY